MFPVGKPRFAKFYKNLFSEKAETTPEDESREVTVVFSEDMQPFPGAKAGVDYHIREFEYKIRVPKNHKGSFVFGQPNLPEDFYTNSKYIKK